VHEQQHSRLSPVRRRPQTQQCNQEREIGGGDGRRGDPAGARAPRQDTGGDRGHRGEKQPPFPGSGRTDDPAALIGPQP